MVRALLNVLRKKLMGTAVRAASTLCHQHLFSSIRCASATLRRFWVLEYRFGGVMKSQKNTGKGASVDTSTPTSASKGRAIREGELPDGGDLRVSEWFTEALYGLFSPRFHCLGGPQESFSLKGYIVLRIIPSCFYMRYCTNSLPCRWWTGICRPSFEQTTGRGFDLLCRPRHPLSLGDTGKQSYVP